MMDNRFMITHGMSKHELYKNWKNIKTRCFNHKAHDFKYYGGRGIIMSHEFATNFKSWFDYITSLPGYENRKAFNLTIDRIDNNNGYVRGNLRWATKLQQTKNRRTIRLAF